MVPDAAGPPGEPGSERGTEPGTEPVDALARELVARLSAAGTTVAVAESLTGGAVVDTLIGVPGASRCVRGGVVAYATDLKAGLLGVPADLLARYGAVHPDVAAAMATGVRTRLGADVGIATTGVAGPDPQDGHPPGLFHVAVDRGDGAVVRTTAPGAGPGTRAAVRAAAVRAALALALELADRAPGAQGTSRSGDALDSM